MVTINEMLLRGKMKISLEPSYVSWSKNRTAQAGGGVATWTRQGALGKVQGMMNT